VCMPHGQSSARRQVVLIHAALDGGPGAIRFKRRTLERKECPDAELIGAGTSSKLAGRRDQTKSLFSANSNRRDDELPPLWAGNRVPTFPEFRPGSCIKETAIPTDRAARAARNAASAACDDPA